MGLLSTNPHILGRDQQFFATAETVPGTQVKPSTLDAVLVETSSFKNNIERAPWLQPAGRDPYENITGKGTVQWSMNTWLYPSGTAGVEPDLSAILTAAIGANNSGSGSKWVYSLTDVQTMGTLSLYRGFNPSGTTDLELSEAIWGAVANKVTITLNGGEPAKISAEGWGMGYALTGVSQLNGLMSSSTTMIVDTVDKNKFNVGSLISIASTNNIKVTVASSAPSFTIDAATSAADDSAVNPYLPAMATAGSPISGVLGTITLHDGSSDQTLKITGFEVSVNNNISAFEDEAFAQYPSDGIPDWRTIEGTITCRLSRDHVIHFANVKEFATRDLYVCCGTAAGSRCKIDIPYAELKFTEISVPKDKEATISIPFVAMPYNGNDGLVLTFD